MKPYFNSIDENIIETETEYAWLGEDNIMYHLCKPNSIHDLQSSNINIEKTYNYLKGSKKNTIVDIRKIKQVSLEARRNYASSKNENNVSAMALIVENTFTKVLANFFIKRNKTNFPTKMFTDLDSAREWLNNNA